MTIKNKKGILQIVEAALAILILFGFMALVLSKQVQSPDLSESIYKTQHQILREIAGNYTLRDDVLKGDYDRINNFTAIRLSPFPLNFSFSIDNPADSGKCNCPGDKEIYADEMIISTNLSEYQPKKLSLFIWAV